jgi:hypothetical protein
MFSNIIMENIGIITVPLWLNAREISKTSLFTYPEIIDNNVGKYEKGLSSVTFKINLKEVLQTLYDKYEYFYISLSQFYTIPYTIRGSQWNNSFQLNENKQYFPLSIQMSGLNFIVDSYSHKNMASNNKVILASISERNIYDAGTGNITADIFNKSYYNESGTGYENKKILFKKQEKAELNFLYITSTGGELPSSLFLNQDFQFQHSCMKLNIEPAF